MNNSFDMSTTDSQTTFRDLLREELVARIKRNPTYSLRAFARALGVSPATISIVISGKKPVTLSLIRKVSPALKLTPNRIKKYQQDLINSVDPESKHFAYQIIDLEQQAIISDWYHYAILNLMRTKGFKSEPVWISRRLGITTFEAQIAFERLIKTGLIEIGANGGIKDASNKFTSHINTNRTTQAARENQRQLFELAKKAIDDVAFDNRNHTGLTLAFNQNDLVRAKEMIAEFRKEFHMTFDQTSNADAVYQLSIGLFPLSKVKTKKGER